MNKNNYQNPSDTQDRYWNFMVELSVHIYYLEKFLRHYQAIERKINCLLAITSTSSIATWAIWQRYNFLWAFLIACSQVLNAIKHLLPFAQREQIIKTILPELSNLFSEVELQYYNVENGLLTDYLIHELTIKFKQRKDKMILEINDNALPERDDFMEKAESKTNIYFHNYYGGVENG